MTRAVADSMPRLSLSQWLAEQRECPLQDRLALLQRLAQQVQALHRSGQIHRAIGIEHVTIDPQGQPQLPPPVGPRCFGGDQPDPEFCPPELAQGSAVELPAEIEAAATILRERGTPLDPRRIDVYQLGVILCQLLTGEPFLNYLYSPTCKAKMPSMARAVLESCLGENGTGPLVDCDGLVAALDALIRQLPIPEKQATSTMETPRSGSVVVGPNDTPPRGSAAVPSSKMPADDKLPFQRLGHFQIVGRIGSGGMGDVYQGYDASLDRYVAVKVLAAPLARDEAFVRRFSAEATAAAKVSHPNVVPIYFIGQDGEHHFFAMQLIDGQSLSQRLTREKRLPVDEAVTIIEQSLAGLGAAHAQGLIHRDVKPGNILLERAGGRAMLVDFGLARHLNADTRMTVTGVIMGTVDYLAPEQALGRAIDGRTDIYSLGVMFYELLAGRLPFLSDSPTSMIFQHAYEAPFPLKQAAPDVPQPLVDIIARMMAKEPADRYASCAAVLADLRAFREGRPVESVILSAWSDEPTARLEAEHLLLPSPSENPWQRARDWAATIFRRYAPEYVQEMQGTTMQMDVAVAQYQRRRDRLANLLKEALSLEGQLPQEQIEDLQEQLSKADATLASLRSQQNVLKARLQAAEAQRQMEGGLPQPRRRRWLVAMAVGTGAIALLSLMLVVPRSNDRPQIEAPASPSAAGLTETQAMIAGLTSDRFAGVKVKDQGGYQALREGSNLWDNQGIVWRKVPSYLNNMVFWKYANRKTGTSQFVIERPGIVLLAVTTRWGTPTSGNTDWRKKAATRTTLLADGWREVGQIEDSSAVTNWLTFWRDCRAGETFDLRTEKYCAPIVILRRDDYAALSGPVITISAGSDQGYVLGAVRANATIGLQYVQGKWKAWGKMATVCPDEEESEGGDRSRLVIAIAPNSAGPGTVLQVIPAGTVRKPFVWRADRDYANVILRINDCSGSRRPGAVQYRIVIEPKDASEASPVLPDARIDIARDAKLNKTQRQFRDRTENSFKGFFSQPGLQGLNSQEKAVKEEELLGQLSSDDSDTRISAINALAVLDSKQAVPGLLQIAAERRQKDNRDRWMAIRALGMIGDPSVVPELVHLTYHYNKNAKIWAQISLVRLTGENFADNVAAWKGWWEKQGGTPPISERRVDWQASGSAGASQPAGVVSSERQAFIIGNSPYWQMLSDMARRKGMTVGKSFNTQYDEFLPLAKGHVLFVETHDGIPIVSLSTLDKFFPGASEGLKTPEGIVNIGNTKIVFVDFSRLRN